MHQKYVLGQKEAGAAVDAILKEAAKQPARPVSVAVVDDNGNLLYFVKMDKAALLTTYMPVLKAYTAARMGTDTASVREMLEGHNWEMSWFGDQKFIPLPGGVPIKKDGAVIGAIGVGGRAAEEDQELAMVGLKAIGL